MLEVNNTIYPKLDDGIMQRACNWLMLTDNKTISKFYCWSNNDLIRVAKDNQLIDESITDVILSWNNSFINYYYEKNL